MKGEQHLKKTLQRLPSTCSEYSDDFVEEKDDEGSFEITILYDFS